MKPVKAFASIFLVVLVGCQQPASNSTVAVVSGEVYDTDLDLLWFRECHKIKDNRDALNAFMWGQRQLVDARNNLDDRGEIKDYTLTKHLVHHSAGVVVKDGVIALAITKGGVTPGE